MHIVNCYGNEKPFKTEDLKSGYVFSQPDTREMQDEDFLNPAFLWVERGRYLWDLKNDKNSKSCAACHGLVENMKGISTVYPKYSSQQQKIINLEQRINLCRKNKLQSDSYKAESKELLSLSALISLQSRGMKMNINIDGKAKKWFEKGKKLYFKKIGQMNLACNQCHDLRVGLNLRAEKVSQGHINGFPSYLLRWNKLASVHRRIQYCNEQARANLLPIFSDDYNALQLYIGWRGNGLILEAPSVRR